MGPTVRKFGVPHAPCVACRLITPGVGAISTSGITPCSFKPAPAFSGYRPLLFHQIPYWFCPNNTPAYWLSQLSLGSGTTARSSKEAPPPSSTSRCVSGSGEPEEGNCYTHLKLRNPQCFSRKPKVAIMCLVFLRNGAGGPGI